MTTMEAREAYAEAQQEAVVAEVRAEAAHNIFAVRDELRIGTIRETMIIEGDRLATIEHASAQARVSEWAGKVTQLEAQAA